MPLNQTFDQRFDLNPGVVGINGERHGRPNKPLLLLAARDLIDEGLAFPDRIPFEEQMPRLVTELRTQFAESVKLEQAIRQNLKGLGYAL